MKKSFFDVFKDHILVQFIYDSGLFWIPFSIIATLYILYRHRYWQRKKFPHLKPSFPFGHMDPLFSTDPIGVHMKNLYQEAKGLGMKHCGIYFIATPVYLILDLGLLKNILSKDFHYFTDRNMYSNERADPISTHLFSIGGPKWKELHAKFAPIFTNAKLKPIFPTFVQCMEILLHDLDATRGPKEFKKVISRYTIDVIGICAFGLNYDEIEDENCLFRVYGRNAFASSYKKSYKMTVATKFPEVARFFGISQVDTDMSDFFTTIVRDNLEHREKHKGDYRDIMQLLIEMKKSGIITFNEIVAQSFIFFMGGYETTTSAMTFALYELAKNHRIQERLRKEIQEVLERYDGEITYNAIGKMKYLNQVVEETLRKYPPFPIITRTSLVDYKIPKTNYTLEKGRRIIIPILGIHRDPEYYPDPEKFDPNRFSDENKRRRNQYTSIPFGEGPRLCIGMRFGLMQIKVGLVGLIRKYKFTVNEMTKEPLKMDADSFILNAEGGIWLNCRRI